MRATAALLRMVRADVLERTRRFSFFVVLAGCIYAANGFLPPNHASYVTFHIDDHRGVYNSAWVGAVVSLMTAVFLSLVGFYLVRNAVDRDRQTRVGEILAATPMGRVQYTLGKTLSNFAALALMALVVAVSAGVAQVVRAEDPHVAAWPLFAPFVFLTLPALLVTAAIAVLFETTPGLRGGFGNVAYFFLWAAALAAGVAGVNALGQSNPSLIGTGVVMPDMFAACKRAFPDADLRNVSMGFNVKGQGTWSLTTFRWAGIDWTPAAVAPRALWVAIGLGLAALAAVPFDRFDPARAGSPFRRRARKKDSRAASATTAVDATSPGAALESDAGARPAAIPHLAPLAAEARAATPLGRLATCAAAEVKLALRGQSRWWYVGWLVMAGFAVFLPLDTARLRVLPLLWLWPVLIWSPMGSRESRHGTDAILFSAPHPLGVQLAATWIAGVVVALAAGLPVGARLALAGDGAALAAWAVGAAFVPALALALGTWTGTSRAFEALYTMLWYVGPLQPVPPLDFMGASRAAVERGTPATFALVTLALLVLATLGRRHRLRR